MAGIHFFVLLSTNEGFTWCVVNAATNHIIL